LDDFDRGIRLAFDNAMLYYEKGTTVHRMAKDMKAIYEKKYEEM